MSLPTLTPSHESLSELPLPHPITLARAGVSGFPSPAQDYEGRKLDLNTYFIKRPAATFFMTVYGDSMTEFGIMEGSIMGRDSVHFGLPSRSAPWTLKSENRSPRWTTRWNEIPRAQAG